MEKLSDGGDRCPVGIYGFKWQDSKTLGDIFLEDSGERLIPLALQPLFSRLAVFRGSITYLRIDAIVATNFLELNPLHPDPADLLQMVLYLGGSAMMDDVAKRPGRFHVGEVHVMDSHEMTWVQKVYCTMGPTIGYHEPLRANDERALLVCYENVMQKLVDHGLRTIAFPCISTHHQHFPNLEAAQLVFKFFQRFFDDPRNREKVDRVVICAVLEADARCYLEVAQRSHYIHVKRDLQATKEALKGVAKLRDRLHNLAHYLMVTEAEEENAVSDSTLEQIHNMPGRIKLDTDKKAD